MERPAWSIATLIILAGVATPAAAYIGPGAGLSLLGALWGLIAAVGVAIGFVVLWPFRRLMRRKKTDRAEQARQAEQQRQSQSSATRETDEKTPSDAHSR